MPLVFRVDTTVYKYVCTRNPYVLVLVFVSLLVCMCDYVITSQCGHFLH